MYFKGKIMVFVYLATNTYIYVLFCLEKVSLCVQLKLLIIAVIENS